MKLILSSLKVYRAANFLKTYLPLCQFDLIIFAFAPLAKFSNEM